ncbi:MAG: metallophosphoesterase family protein [Balneolales bacterium]
MYHLNNRIAITLIIVLGFFIFGGCSGPRMTVESSINDNGTEEPQRIMINPLESGERGVSITWRTALGVEESFVQWGIAKPNPVTNFDRFQIKEASARQDTVRYDGQTSVFRSFRTKLSALEPGSTYMYRVGHDDAGWSEWIHFDLPQADPDSALTFIYLGDPQNDLHSQWSRTIRQAYSAAPDASFLLYAGDLVNRGFNDHEWFDWYRAGDFVHRMIPSIMTPGNHEYDYPDLTPLWQTNFTLPDNGPEGDDELYGACYYVDYPAVRIISLDGTTSENDSRLRAIQAEWLEEVLKATDKQWIILTLHQPFYSTKETRDNPQIREAYKDLLDEYGVDIVLQGHDHAYGRGMLDEEADGPGTTGTMYVVSVSGPKMYEIGDEKSWMQKQLDNTQMYQVITIDGDQLFFKSYTTTGTLFDEFKLKKSGENRVVLK